LKYERIDFYLYRLDDRFKASKIMNIQLPSKKGTPNANPTIDFDQLVIIGANGAGKTRLGSRIEQTYLGQTHRISAQKSLTFPSFVSPTSKSRAGIEFKYGGYYAHFTEESQYLNQKVQARWGGNINTSLLNDFDKLLVLLHTEEYEDSLSFKEGRIDKPTTKLDRVQKIWEEVLPHRKLLKSAGVIETYPTDNPANTYNATEMSDGERVIFYLIGEVICAEQNSIIIIDEPEMHIHKSLIKTLFDLIEIERPDCSFIYLTHDIDFAFTRQNAVKIWAKSYEGNDVWDYEILDETSPIPEQLYLEVLGSRKPIIFLEGESSSIDYEIYEQVYDGHTLKPLGSCNKVIQVVNAFNEQKEFHHIDSFGIVDRDRRQHGDVVNLNAKGIWVLDVAEAENLLLLESIVKSVASHMGKDAGPVFAQVKQNLIDFFRNQLELQILLHFKEVLRRDFMSLTNFPSRTIADVITEIDGLYYAINKQALFDNVKAEFDNVLANNDYNSVLRLFNLKNALIPNSNVCDLTGVRNKEEYLSLVITLLKKKDSVSQTIKVEIDSKIIK
jgi:ABC-type cobalamin/Fe3+-siderophores transport system ATPase subunit